MNRPQVPKPRSALLGCALLVLAAPAVADAPFIWKLPGERNTVWLMGSVHVLRETDYPLPAAYTEVYEAAETLVMEIDLDDLNPLEAQRALTLRGKAAPDSSLRGLMGSDAYKAAVRKADAIGIDIERFDAIEPWYAALTVVQLRLLELGYDPRFGVDHHFAGRAAADGKPVEGLESIDEQLAILDELSPALQREFLLQSLDDAAMMDEELLQVLGAWHAGDAALLERELLGSLREYPALYEGLVVRRNRNWLGPIRQLRREPKDVLVIVGALHLIGEDSVIGMLRAEGVEVERLDE